MNRPRLQKQIFRVVAWLAVAAVSAMVALAQEPASGRGDSQIEMDVVHALDAAPQLKNDLITAATIQGEVTLSGTVATAEERKLAESIVTKVEGVGRVHNNLKVGDPNAAGDLQNLPPADDPMNQQGQQNQQNQQGQQQDAGPAPPSDYAYPTPQPNPNQQQNGQYPVPPPSPYGQQGQYPPNRPAYPPQYGYQAYPPQPAYHPAPGPITLPPGTLMVLRTVGAVESKRAKEGEPIDFTLIHDVNVNGYTVVPRGATVHGVVAEVKNPERGDLGGSPVVALHLVSLDLGGQNYPLQSDDFRAVGPNKAGHTAASGFTGALLGAVIGGIAGGGKGAAIGAGAGAGAGVVAGAATQGPGVWIPAEARVDFRLKAPLTVNPVGQDEAARLAQGLYPGGPTLYRRGPYGGPAYGYPYYGYPPIYYHPYVMMGGYYSWR